MKPSIYLAGPIADDESGGREYRQTIIERAGDRFEWYDPLDIFDLRDGTVLVYQGEEIPEGHDYITTDELVDREMAAIQEADGILAHARDCQMWGTPQEVFWAWRDLGKPSVIWRDEGVVRSVWQDVNSTFVSDDLDECLDVLEQETVYQE